MIGSDQSGRLVVIEALGLGLLDEIRFDDVDHRLHQRRLRAGSAGRFMHSAPSRTVLR